MTDQPTTDPSAVERVADLLIEHSRYRIEDCYCGWADLGKSHAAHVAQALADARLLAPAPQPAANRLESVRNLHKRNPLWDDEAEKAAGYNNTDDMCVECWDDWPCDTVKILDGGA